MIVSCSPDHTAGRFAAKKCRRSLRARVSWSRSHCTLAMGVGTVGYLLISELGPLDAFYQTMITLSTVGYGEVEPFGRAEKIFTAFLIVFGVGTALYALSAIIQEALEGDLRSQLYRGRERMRIGQLKGHTIICGFGRVGQEIARELSERGIEIVLIDAQASQIERARALGYLVVKGDATHEDTLIRAQAGHGRHAARRHR